MATLTSYGTTTGGSTWTNPANALYSPGSFASLTSTVVATYTMNISAFGFAANLPDNAVIDRVVVTVPHYVSNTARWSAPTLAAYLADIVIAGTSNTLTLSTSTANVNTVTYTNLTATQLRANNFTFRYSIPKSGTTSATVNLDFIKVDIDYRTESWQEVKL